MPLSFSAAQTGCGEASSSDSILFDVLQADPDTLVMATYDGEFYAGTPAFTFHPSVGQGGVFYIATGTTVSARGAWLPRALR